METVRAGKNYHSSINIKLVVTFERFLKSGVSKIIILNGWVTKNNNNK